MRPFAMAGLAMFLVLGCGKESVTPPNHTTPGVIVVNTVAELDNALLTSVAGDTIEIRAEFSSASYVMQRGYTIPASRSPLRIIGGSSKLGSRAVLIFPASVTALTFTGHDGSSVEELDFEGGSDVFHLQDSNVRLQALNVRDNARDGVLADGDSDGSVDSCLFENPGRFGVHTESGADLTIRSNTIVGADDSGMFINSNASVHNNNIYGSVVNGIACGLQATTPSFSCNDAFGSATNYACGDLVLPGGTNYEVDPLFCAPGDYYIRDVSALAPLNSGGCGLIGKFPVGCGPGGS